MTQSIFESKGYEMALYGKISDEKISIQVDSIDIIGYLHCHDPYDMSVQLIHPEHLQSNTSCGHVPYFAKGNTDLIKVDASGKFTERAIKEGKDNLEELYRRELLIYENKKYLFQELEKVYQQTLIKYPLAIAEYKRLYNHEYDKYRKLLNEGDESGAQEADEKAKEHSSNSFKKSNMLESVIENFMEKHNRCLFGSYFFSQDIIYRFFKENHPEEL